MEGKWRIVKGEVESSEPREVGGRLFEFWICCPLESNISLVENGPRYNL